MHEQANPKDKIAAIYSFEKIVQSIKAFSGKPLHHFKNRLGRDRASIPLARGGQGRAPGGHLGRPAGHTAEAHPASWRMHMAQPDTQGGAHWQDSARAREEAA